VKSTHAHAPFTMVECGGNFLALWVVAFFFGNKICSPICFHIETRDVCATNVAFPFTLKSIFKAKEELWKLNYFTMPKYNLHKTLKKKPKSFKILELHN